MNPLSPKLITGTLGELLVQTRLLQYDVQAAPPLKDSGNDLIAIRGHVFRAIQVKATDGDSYVVPDPKRKYHILAAVRLDGSDDDVFADRCEIYLIKKEELDGLPRKFAEIAHLRMSAVRVDELFPRGAPDPEAAKEPDDADVSHVINLSTVAPFDKPEFRWTTFVGEFVRPVMRGRDALYWFTNYGNHVRLRVRCEKSDHDAIQQRIDRLMAKFQFEYRRNGEGVREESNYTMEGDLGGPRFLGAERKDITPTERSLRVLQLLHAAGQLYLHCLVRDGIYWREEESSDHNNPYGSSSFSYLHLSHNLTGSDIRVFRCEDLDGRELLLSEYYHNNALGAGKLKADKSKPFRVRV